MSGKSSIHSEIQITSQSSDIPLPDEDHSDGKILTHCETSTTSVTLDNTPEQIVYRSTCTESKSLEDRKTDEFLDTEYKKNVSNEIRQRNREKKLRF